MAKADSLPEPQNSFMALRHRRSFRWLSFVPTSSVLPTQGKFSVGSAANTTPHLREYARPVQRGFLGLSTSPCHHGRRDCFPTEWSTADEFDVPFAGCAPHRRPVFRTCLPRVAEVAQSTQVDQLPQRRVRGIRQSGTAGRADHEPGDLGSSGSGGVHIHEETKTPAEQARAALARGAVCQRGEVRPGISACRFRGLACASKEWGVT